MTSDRAGDERIALDPLTRKPLPQRAVNVCRGRWLIAVVYGYGALIGGLWAWMFWAGDQQWLATLVLFGPRWLCALPLPLLFLVAAIGRRRLLGPLTLIGAFIVGPIMGFQVHLPRWSSGHPRLRVLTCNVGEKLSTRRALLDLIVREQPDVVALQEAKQGAQFFWPPDWSLICNDEFVVASRWLVTQHEAVYRPDDPTKICAIRFKVKLPDDEVQFFNVHFQTPRPGLEAVLNRRTGLDFSRAGELEKVLRRRAAESERASDWIEQFGAPTIVMGDFNTPVESTIFHRYWSSLDDAFRQRGWGFGFTKISEKDGWSYGARIDHVLFTPPWRCVRCWVGDDVGSDHLPLLADFQ
jgi:vancomycin resistance protein VanJ